MGRIRFSTLSIAFGTCALALACLQPRPALAAPEDQSDTYFYSDDTYTDIVGLWEVRCYPPFYQLVWGRETIYAVTGYVTSCGGGKGAKLGQPNATSSLGAKQLASLTTQPDGSTHNFYDPTLFLDMHFLRRSS
jgi:hypothetical protein